MQWPAPGGLGRLDVGGDGPTVRFPRAQLHRNTAARVIVGAAPPAAEPQGGCEQTIFRNLGRHEPVMNIEHKPFQAPLLRLDAHGATTSGRFIAEGRRVPVGNCCQWLLNGWAIFHTAPATWMGISAAFLTLTLVVSFIPVLAVAINLVIPVLIGGVAIGCRAIEDDDRIRFTHLFAGFFRRPGSLLLVGVFYLLAVLALAMVAGLVAAVGGSGDPSSPLLTVGFATTLLLFVPLAMAFWLAPPLVVFHDFSALQAIQTSFAVARRNFVPFFLYGVLVLLAAVIASLPLLLGWLLLLPVLYASQYAFYRDVFFEP